MLGASDLEAEGPHRRSREIASTGGSSLAKLDWSMRRARRLRCPRQAGRLRTGSGAVHPAGMSTRVQSESRLRPPIYDPSFHLRTAISHTTAQPFLAAWAISLPVPTLKCPDRHAQQCGSLMPVNGVIIVRPKHNFVDERLTHCHSELASIRKASRCMTLYFIVRQLSQALSAPLTPAPP